MAAERAPYRMTLTLNVLNHLGLNLYSNVPSVLSEVVANSWDADARNVSITISSNPDTVEISDDGIGMDQADINDKYLTVGYERRLKGEAFTPELGRPVMGRKGIGKLSLFSIAQTVEVHSVKAGQRQGFQMKLQDIRDQITAGNGEYEPQPINAEEVKVPWERGTRLVITNFKRQLIHTESSLRKRLARRFSIIGDEHSFEVSVDGKAIGVADRDYFHKLQYVWAYGDKGKPFLTDAKNALRKHERPGNVAEAGDVWGWIGTVERSGSLKDDGENLNKITVLMRGKLAQEDILEEFGESGVYAQYLIGELNADFLDADDDEDAATSSRQRIKEDDPRYVALREFVWSELKHIQGQWTEIRNQDGLSRAQEIPIIAEWYQNLPKEHREAAKRLFGKINQLPIDDERDRRNLIKNSVLAFESLRYKQNLERLEHVAVENLAAVAEMFADYDDIEATLYHQIVRERVAVIKALQTKVEEAAKEKVVQEHIFTHLWLLDASWERAAATEMMEKRVGTEFAKVDAGLTKKEREGRFDIKYRTTSHKHVIIELKKPDRVVSTFELLAQVDKYRTALKKVLAEVGKSNEAVEFVCIVGRELRDWGGNPQKREESRRMLGEIDARVVMYQELIDNAQAAYSDYLKKDEQAGRVYQLVQQLEAWEAEAADGHE